MFVGVVEQMSAGRDSLTSIPHSHLIVPCPTLPLQVLKFIGRNVVNRRRPSSAKLKDD